MFQLILLPLGLRDLNSARRNTTERYLLECDEIFVVAVEGRATTDEGVQSVIELAKKARLSNVGIVCTKSDVSIFECMAMIKYSLARRTLDRQRLGGIGKGRRFLRRFNK